MHDISPFFDCWTDPVNHLLILQSSIAEGDGGFINPISKLLCCGKPQNMQHMHTMFDCWANPVDHLPLLKSSIVERDEGFFGQRCELFCLWQTQNIMQHMHGIFPYMLD